MLLPHAHTLAQARTCLAALADAASSEDVSSAYEHVLIELDRIHCDESPDIYLDAVPAPRSSGRARAAYSPPALQAITRDFAFIVPPEATADSLLRAIRGADKALITGVRLFDRFETSDGLSLAFEVTLQPTEKSFTDEQIGEVSKRIVAGAEKLGARLRT